MKKIKWKKRSGAWTFEQAFPSLGFLYGEINYDDEDLFSVEIQSFNDDVPYFYDTFVDIKTLKEAQSLAEKEITKALTSELKKIQSFLKKKVKKE